MKGLSTADGGIGDPDDVFCKKNHPFSLHTCGCVPQSDCWFRYVKSQIYPVLGTQVPIVCAQPSCGICGVWRCLSATLLKWNRGVRPCLGCVTAGFLWEVLLDGCDCQYHKREVARSVVDN